MLYINIHNLGDTEYPEYCKGCHVRIPNYRGCPISYGTLQELLFRSELILVGMGLLDV